MSLETDRSERGRRIVLGSLVGGAAILVVSWWSLRGEPVAPAATEPPAQAVFAGGVQAAAVDSARWDPDPAVGDEAARAAAVRMPVPAPAPELPVQTARGPVPAEQLAQQAADLAADAERNRLIAERQKGPTAALQAALAGRRAALTRACMTGDAPDSVTLSVQARFAADGSMVGHSVSGESSAVAECVGRQPLALAVPASDAGVAVAAELRLP